MGHITGKEFLEDLNFDLIIKHEIKHIFVNKPTFEKYTEVDEVYKKLINLAIPSEDIWNHLCEITKQLSSPTGKQQGNTFWGPNYQQIP